MKAELCKMAAEQRHVPLKQLYTEFSRRPEIVAAAETIPGFESCKTQMHRARQQVMPPVPTARTDINLEGEWKETTTGQNFLLHQDEDILMFATDSNLRQLAATRTIFMDGTFKSTPRLFTQLFTIHGQYREHIVPLVYCLLPDKKRETYYNVLDIIKRKLAEMELVFDPDYVISDFETAQIGAVSTQLPRTHQRGCLFHFSQAVYKKVQKYHLSDLYFANPDVKSFIRQLLALPFLPATDIEPTFETLLQKDTQFLCGVFTAREPEPTTT